MVVVPTVHDAWMIDAAEGAEWRRLNYPGQPGWLAIRLRLAPTADGVAVVAAQIERRDGRALTARDLRLVKLPPNWVLFGESASRWFAPAEGTAPVAAARKGARGKDDEHWRAVYSVWLQAVQTAPRAPVKWMLASGRWPVTDATMRRWIARARERAAALGWPATLQPQKGTHFLRQGEERPAAMVPGDGADTMGISAIEGDGRSEQG
jgi:hypothetical protein